jgi:hypothetical protein
MARIEGRIIRGEWIKILKQKRNDAKYYNIHERKGE